MSDRSGTLLDSPLSLGSIELPHSARAQHDGPRQHSLGLRDSEKTKRNCRGRILNVNSEAYTYEVVIDGNSKPVVMGRMMADFNDATLLPIGAMVAVSYDYGQPVIIGVLPVTSSRSVAGAATPTISGNPATPEARNQPAGAYCRMPHMPTDLLPQDKALVGPDGNMIGALTGGLNVMKSGMAQVRTNALNDLVEIVCRNFRHISNFGVSEIKHVNGKVTWSLRGGTDQTSECGPDQENWTVRVDVGGERLFHFELTNNSGSTLFKISVNDDGQVEIEGADGINMTSGRNWDDRVAGNYSQTIDGTDTQQVAGAQNVTINGNRAATVSGSETRVVGNDLTETAVRHRTESTGGQHSETITGGNPLTALPLQWARKTNVVNGSWVIDIGNPLALANPAALSGLDVSTYTGDISLQVKLLGNITLATLAGIATLKTTAGIANVDGTAVLLGPVIGAINPLVKGIPYAAAFSAMATTITAACAATAGFSTMEPGLAAFGTAVSAAMATLLGALPGTLSTKSFTA